MEETTQDCMCLTLGKDNTHRMDKCMNGQMGGRTDGWTDAWTNE
jgi:hypothetical protein